MTAVFLAVVLIGVVVLLMTAWKNRTLKKCTHLITAEVVEHRRDTMSESLDYNPVVQYTWQGKVWRRCMDRRLGAKEIAEQYPIGQDVPIYIDPDQPRYFSENPQRDQNSNILVLCLVLIVVVYAVFSQGGN